MRGLEIDGGESCTVGSVRVVMHCGGALRSVWKDRFQGRVWESGRTCFFGWLRWLGSKYM